MAKRSQKEASESSQHWYQDKYQHVLTQRNVLALVALVALFTAMLAVLTVLRLAPLKSVEPYLLQIDEKSGITQKVNPLTRAQYTSNEAIDKYFTTQYIRVRESYNTSILLYNYNIVRIMSAPSIFRDYRKQIDINSEGSLAKKMGQFGRRDMKIRSIVYLTDPSDRNKQKKKKEGEGDEKKIMQARITTSDIMPAQADVEQQWVVTITFEYANVNLNESEQLLNPLGYQVVNYQIQREIN